MHKSLLPLLILTSILTACSPGADPSLDSAGDGIVGGDRVELTDPLARQVVIIQITAGPEQKSRSCTGSFLSEKIVLTAAHCVIDHSSVKVRIKLSKNKYQTRRASKVVAYPTYSKDHPNSDIALLFLSEPFNEKILISNLPSTRMNLNQKEVLALGYGRVSGVAADKPKKGMLYQTKLPVIQFNMLDSVFFVDQNSGRGTCHGDSGGPIFTESNGQNYLVGIVKGGRPTKQDHLPLDQQDQCNGKGRYVNLQLPEHLAWLNAHLKSENDVSEKN